jgi:hypothetical protein
MNTEDSPATDAAEMNDTTPETVVENEATEKESYEDIGARRMAAVSEKVSNFKNKISGFINRGWGKVKSFGSATAEAGKSALTYTLSAPERVSGAKDAVVEGARAGEAYMSGQAEKGINYAADKFEEGADYIAAKGQAMYEGTKDAGVAAAGRVVEEVVYFGAKAKEGFDGALKYGKTRFEKLKERALDAKSIFGAAVEEARRRKAERVAKNLQNHPEYANALNNLLTAQERLEAVRTKLTVEGGLTA